MILYFDLDGTILDVSDRYYKVYGDLLTELGLQGLSKEVYWNLKRQQVPEKVILEKTVSSELLEDLNEKRLERIEQMNYLQYDRVVEGAYRVLDELSSYHRLSLVTLRKNTESLSQELKSLNLGDYFSAILHMANNTGDWQTKADLIKRDLLGTTMKAAILGDTEADILAGKEVGITTCVVAHGIRTEEALVRYSPDYVIHDLNEFPRIIATFL